jgi:hypothetical protein
MKRWLRLLIVPIILTGCAWVQMREVRPQLPPGAWQGDGYAQRISTWDRTGANADNIQILSGETQTLADIKGPGIIRHIWMTTNTPGPNGRTLVLRFYWDGSPTPAVEVPYGDFFALGNAMLADVNSWPITVTSRGRSCNCWWTMPFAKGVRITITNEGAESQTAFYCHVDYLALEKPPADPERLHAQYRQAYPADFPENYTILETAGRGRYAGCVMSVESTKPQWWGEGDDLIEVDDHEPIRGTGTEDYFCDAWGMHQHLTLWHGCPATEGFTSEGLRTTMYRFHILDPIPFREKIKVSIEHGTQNDRADNISSVAFWYQVPPASPFPALPLVEERIVGADRIMLVRQRAWQYAASGEADARDYLVRLRKRAKNEENAALMDGLIAYAEGLKEPTDAALANVEANLARLHNMVNAQPASEHFTARKINLPTDDDSPVPSATMEGFLALERARYDLARRVALKRGFRPGDEVVIEARDPLGRVTPPPAYQQTKDFTNSYAKVTDTHLMGNGARFTYGKADPSWARFTPALPRAGRYEVLTIFSYGANAADTRYEVRYADGATTVPLQQRGRPGTPGRNDAVWHSLGTYRFDAGQNPDKGSVTLHASPGTAIPNKQFEYRAYADSIRFVFKGE